MVSTPNWHRQTSNTRLAPNALSLSLFANDDDDGVHRHSHIRESLPICVPNRASVDIRACTPLRCGRPVAAAADDASAASCGCCCCCSRRISRHRLRENYVAAAAGARLTTCFLRPRIARQNPHRLCRLGFVPDRFEDQPNSLVAIIRMPRALRIVNTRMKTLTTRATDLFTANDTNTRVRDDKRDARAHAK